MDFTDAVEHNVTVVHPAGYCEPVTLQRQQSVNIAL